MLIPWILEVVERIIASDKNLSSTSKKNIRILEPFAGSCRVGHALKKKGFFVIAGDYLTFAYTLAKSLIEADLTQYPPDRLKPIFEKLNSIQGKKSWFSDLYGQKARFFQPFNAEKIAAIREAIDYYSQGDETLKAILLTSLLIAADKVDSTTGLQMAYLKEWAPRSYNPLRLEYPPLLPGPGLAYLGDALAMAPTLDAEIAYLDPPYNQHSYIGNYHIWETLVLYDNPEVYGVALKRKDVKERKSAFNSKQNAKEALYKLIHALKTPYIILSFNNEGYLTKEELYSICTAKGPTLMLTRPHKRYIGAKIGIYNPKGEKVGIVSHTSNKEFLFVIFPDKGSYEAFQVGLGLQALSPSFQELRLF